LLNQERHAERVKRRYVHRDRDGSSGRLEPVDIVTADQDHDGQENHPTARDTHGAIFRNERRVERGAKETLTGLAKKLKPGDSVILTGYAKGDLALALGRARIVLHFLSSKVKVRATLASVTSVGDKKVTVTSR